MENQTIEYVDLEITGSDTIRDEKFEGKFPMPATVQGCVTLWGEQAVWNQIAQRIKGRLGHKVRTLLGKDKTSEEIQMELFAYVPATPIKKVKLSETEEEFLQDLKNEPDANRRVQIIEDYTNRLKKVT